MNTVERINKLDFDVSKKDEQYEKLEEALKEYHSLIDSGIIKARENKIQQIYKPSEFSFSSNLNRECN